MLPFLLICFLPSQNIFPSSKADLFNFGVFYSKTLKNCLQTSNILVNFYYFTVLVIVQKPADIICSKTTQNLKNNNFWLIIN